MDLKKAQNVDDIPNKPLRIGASGIAHRIPSLMKYSFQWCIP